MLLLWLTQMTLQLPEIYKRWWSVLTEIGLKFCHYPEPTKTWQVVKRCVSEKVESAFFGTKIKITTEVHKYVCGSVGTRKFKDL